VHGNRFVLHLVFRSLGNYESATPEDFEEIKKRIPELALRHLARRKGSDEDLVSDFCEELEVLLTHETRIVQRKGWLFWHFRCEYRAGENWKSVCSQSAFRAGRFKPPQISGRR
jgi:hypothetical protein